MIDSVSTPERKGRSPAPSSVPPSSSRRSRTAVSVGAVVAAAGAAGVGATIPSLVDGPHPLNVAAAAGFAAAAIAGAGLIERGRNPRAAVAPPVEAATPAEQPVLPPWPAPAARSRPEPSRPLPPPAGELPVIVSERGPAEAPAPETGDRLVEEYRQWVLEQAIGDGPFRTLEIEGDRRRLFLLSAGGVSTLLAWLHEQHHATYTVDTWVDEILPGQGIEIEDRSLAVELLIAAALHAGGVHSAPTSRLSEYRTDELIDVMAAVHVGLLRLYSGLGHRPPAAAIGQFQDIASGPPEGGGPV